MYSVHAQAFLERNLSHQQNSIQRYQFKGEQVWIKKAGKHHSIWLFKILGFFSHLFRLRALTPVPNTGGQRAISIEAQRLKLLKQKGINVPELLAFNHQGLMLADLGQNLAPSLQLETAFQRSTSAKHCLALYQNTVDALHHVHLKDTWLSEAFLRNMVLDKNQQIAFLDFESDPGHFMNKHLCFARDWLCLIFSSSIYLKKHGVLKQASDYLQHTIKQESLQTYTEVVAVTRILNWLDKLPLHKLGKDGRRLMAVITLLTYLKALL